MRTPHALARGSHASRFGGAALDAVTGPALGPGIAGMDGRVVHRAFITADRSAPATPSMTAASSTAVATHPANVAMAAARREVGRALWVDGRRRPQAVVLLGPIAVAAAAPHATKAASTKAPSNAAMAPLHGGWTPIFIPEGSPVKHFVITACGNALA
jgi:hypothetical protein